MNKFGEREVLLKLIEYVGKDWDENSRPEDIRLSADKIQVLLSIRSLVASADNDLDIPLLRRECPSFCAVYRNVMLREIEELDPNGSDYTGTNSGGGPEA